MKIILCILILVTIYCTYQVFEPLFYGKDYKKLKYKLGSMKWEFIENTSICYPHTNTYESGDWVCKKYCDGSGWGYDYSVSYEGKEVFPKYAENIFFYISGLHDKMVKIDKNKIESDILS